MSTYDDRDKDFHVQDRDGIPVLVRPMTEAAGSWAKLHLPEPDSNGTIEITGSLQAVTTAMVDAGLTFTYYWKDSDKTGI